MPDSAQCPYCFSTKVEVVDSYERRDVVVVKCLNCGRVSDLDAENLNAPPVAIVDPDGPTASDRGKRT
jgi:uncharacterized Zn finger protein